MLDLCNDVCGRCAVCVALLVVIFFNKDERCFRFAPAMHPPETLLLRPNNTDEQIACMIPTSSGNLRFGMFQRKFV